MALPTRLCRPAALLTLIAVLTGCGTGSADQACACSPDRFHGADGIIIPPGPSEPSWWIDPIIDKGHEQPSGPVVVEVSVPADTLFEVGSSSITPTANAALDAVSTALNGDVIVNADLNCHADTTGPPAANQTLSEQRATSLSGWIATHWHIPVEQITKHGHGDTRPVASNDTPTGRAQNRRCEITLTLERHR